MELLRRPALWITLGLLGVLVVVGIIVLGGGDDGPEDILEQTFSGDKEVTSGVIDVSVEVGAQGREGGQFAASLNGPVQGEDDEFPEFALTVSAKGQGGGEEVDFDAGAISTGEEGFISYQGTDYAVDQPTFEAFKQGYLQAQTQAEEQGDEDPEAFFEQFDIDPSDWITNLQDEGTEDLDGVEVIHISGDANVEQIITDLVQVAQQAPAASEQIPDLDVLDAASEQISEAVTEASIDVYTGEDDKILRGLDLALTIAPPEVADAGVDAVDGQLTLRLSDVNQPQTIEAPTDTKPLRNLLDELGVDLGPLSALGAGGSGLDLGTGGETGGGESGGVANPEEAQAYLDCLEQAQEAEDVQAEIQKCAEELGTP